MPEIFKPTKAKRILFFVFLDSILSIISLYVAFNLRFDFDIPEGYLRQLKDVLGLFVIVKIASLSAFKVYLISWRFVSLNELLLFTYALLTAEALLMILVYIPMPMYPVFLPDLPISSFPRSIFLIDFAISLLAISGLRISKRMYLEVLKQKISSDKENRAIIIGSGDLADMLIRDMIRDAETSFMPVAILDDDAQRQGLTIHGLKVVGQIKDLPEIIQSKQVNSIFIADTKIDRQKIRWIYETAKKAGIRQIKIIPNIYKFSDYKPSVQALEDISIEDIIGRQSINIDYSAIKDFIANKIVLVTGAGGSIGSELSLQLCGFAPSRLILLDMDETALHNISLKLHKSFAGFKDRIVLKIADIRDFESTSKIFETYKPQIVFHSAAYKHVPMMEYNPEEAVKNNIFGTYNLAQIAVSTEVKRFVMISTDKAVLPTSVMGATKRVAEYICTAFNYAYSSTEFISVRFGNVLGSRGSVLPLFLEQLKQGGPLTVTHEDMQRYFMTIPEAVSLVLQAGVNGSGGEVLVLDMGEPVRILKLAEDIISLHGLTPYVDIDIKITGLRPGEKLFEELLTAEEGTLATRHEKIFTAKSVERFTLDEINSMIDEFKRALNSDNSQDAIRQLLRKWVKHYS